MSDGMFIDRAFVRDLQAMRRDWLLKSRRQPAAKPVARVAPPRKLFFRNLSGESVPPFGVMQVSDVDAGHRDYYQIEKPDGTGTQFLLNGPREVAHNARGEAFRRGRAIFDDGDGTPAHGETWGPKAAQWTLAKDNEGFEVAGGVVSPSGETPTVVVWPKAGADPFAITMTLSGNGAVYPLKLDGSAPGWALDDDSLPIYYDSEQDRLVFTEDMQVYLELTLFIIATYPTTPPNRFVTEGVSAMAVHDFGAPGAHAFVFDASLSVLWPPTTLTTSNEPDHNHGGTTGGVADHVHTIPTGASGAAGAHDHTISNAGAHGHDVTLVDSTLMFTANGHAAVIDNVAAGQHVEAWVIALTSLLDAGGWQYFGNLNIIRLGPTKE